MKQSQFNQGDEHDRDFTRMDLGIYVHSSENIKRTPSRAAVCAKMGLNILLVAFALSCWWSLFDFSKIPLAAGLAMIYVLCLIITPNESPNEN
jgi:hypothetical protein